MKAYCPQDTVRNVRIHLEDWTEVGETKNYSRNCPPRWVWRHKNLILSFWMIQPKPVCFVLKSHRRCWRWRICVWSVSERNESDGHHCLHDCGPKIWAYCWRRFREIDFAFHGALG